MKILVVSDTHGHEENFEKVIKKIGVPDMILHLGDSEGGEEIMRDMADCPIYLVAGNCDFFCDYPKSRIVEAEGIRIFMTHGHYYYVGLGLDDLAKATKENECQLALFGHTHKPVLEKHENGVTILNPGSLSFPRQEGRRPGYALIEIAENMEVQCEVHFL